MVKTFYQFLMRYKNIGGKDELSVFANHVFLDHGFPKGSSNYDEISRYLEIEGDYLTSMSIFDKAWELYLLMEKQKSKNF